MVRFNSVTLDADRPSILGPGFTAPPGGPEYLNRKELELFVLYIKVFYIIKAFCIVGCVVT